LCAFPNAGENQAVIAANDDAIIVAFRGTDNINNAFTDLHVQLVGGPLGKVHEGFAQALNLLWLDVVQAVLDTQQASEKRRSLWFTRHSLGGALATLAVAKFIERQEPIDGLYTYGCPRCGDDAFASAFDASLDRVYRFVYRNDIVTRVPPRQLLGYQHVGTVKYINTQCEITGELEGWAAFLQAVKVTLDDMHNQDFNAVADHHLANYLKCLQKNAEAP
jgi:triacylglycerol lipase